MTHFGKLYIKPIKNLGSISLKIVIFIFTFLKNI